MKFKVVFSLVLLLITLFSISSICASENLTGDCGSNPILAADDNQILAAGEDSPDVDAVGDGEEDSAKLVVTSKASQYSPGYDDNVDFEITVRSVGGVSHNTAVIIYYGGLEYVSHHADKGSYSPNEGEWKVGDLADGEVARMVITLKTISRFDPDFHVYLNMCKNTSTSLSRG